MVGLMIFGFIFTCAVYAWCPDYVWAVIPVFAVIAVLWLIVKIIRTLVKPKSKKSQPYEYEEFICWDDYEE